ncbi:MAG: polysaccharide deacetylase family protein [Flavobacteriales bacterium]|nr:polysaccharide deacetylase family protein [Flavobacteriales bacterium]
MIGLNSLGRLHFKIKDTENVHLTFDDGPHPEITPWVLEQLSKHQQKATFFILGKNAEAHPEIVERILHEGHKIGNHSYDHPNGWNTPKASFVDNVLKAKDIIDSELFRPPYGKITPGQISMLKEFKIIMWDVLTGDYDQSKDSQKMLERIIKKTQPGSIIVFHDSEKARENLFFVLPKYLNYLFQARINSAIIP